jgi:OOP family OmpA-OmpF porin
MKTKAVIAVLGLAGAALAFPAAAQVSLSSVYIGGGLGQSKAKDGCSGFNGTCDDSDTAFKIFGGYQFNRYIAAEIGYTDLGKTKASAGAQSLEVKASAWELSAVGSYPVWDQLSILGRLGAYYGEGKLSSNFGAGGNKKTTNLTLGLGVQYDFTKNFGVRGEWQRYAKIKTRDDTTGIEGESDVDVFGASILYRFQ